jgi:hypothetical protein
MAESPTIVHHLQKVTESPWASDALPDGNRIIVRLIIFDSLGPPKGFLQSGGAMLS